jgi:hypothetical protein
MSNPARPSPDRSQHKVSLPSHTNIAHIEPEVKQKIRDGALDKTISWIAWVLSTQRVSQKTVCCAGLNGQQTH